MVSEKKLFGTTKDGKEIYLYTMENKNGMKAVVMNYGANLVELWVPDKSGKSEDVVLGYDKLESYFANGCFFGATVGPSANRIANASFVLDGEKARNSFVVRAAAHSCELWYLLMQTVVKM